MDLFPRRGQIHLALLQYGLSILPAPLGQIGGLPFVVGELPLVAGRLPLVVASPVVSSGG